MTWTGEGLGLVRKMLEEIHTRSGQDKLKYQAVI